MVWCVLKCKTHLSYAIGRHALYYHVEAPNCKYSPALCGVLSMQMVRIRLTGESKARGFVELARRIRMICLPNDEYLIAAENMHLLNELDISYEVLGREDFQNAIREIRSAIAIKV